MKTYRVKYRAGDGKKACSWMSWKGGEEEVGKHKQNIMSRGG